MRKLIAVVSLALLAGAGLLWGRQAQPPSRVVQTVVRDAGYFYRFKAGFEVKATGERLDFDTVVACNIRVTRWRDGGLSDDTTISPKVMIKATAGGQAVMLYTLRGCSGLTSEDEDVPPDVLPLAIWFDSVEDFSNGLAYVSEDAYDSPRGKLVFHGARIERATRADWEAWRKAAADEYVERGALPGPWGYDYPGHDQRHGLVRYVSSCEGYSRIKLPEVIRQKIRPFWPFGQPRFWALSNEDDHTIASLLSDPGLTEPPGGGRWISRFGTPGSGGGFAWSGVPVRSGRWVQRRPHVPSRWPTETYPFLLPPQLSADPMDAPAPTQPADVYVHRLDFREGALNGFGACHVTGGPERVIDPVDPGWRRKAHVFMVDDQPLRRIEGGGGFLAPTFLFERDEYVFIRFGIAF